MYDRWNKEEDQSMLQLALPCCIFEENEPEEFENFFQKDDALTHLDPDKALPKLNGDEYNECKPNLRWAKS